MVTKTLPHDIENEESLMGAIIIDGSTIRKVINIVSPDDLYSERNKTIYQACLDIYNRHEAINTATLAHELSRTGKLEDIGGHSYLIVLPSMCPTTLDVEDYASIVKRLSISRKLISVSEEISNIGYYSLPDINEIINKSSDLFDGFRKANSPHDKRIVTPKQAGLDIIELVTKYSEPSCSPKWGFYALDGITAGIEPEYIIFGARPSIGKTQILMDIAQNQTGKVLFVSAEMTYQQIYERILARELKMSILDIRKRGLSLDEQSAIMEIAGNVSETNIYWLAGKIFLNDVYREISNMLDKGKLDMVFIDYIGALQDCYVENRDSQVVRISRVSNRIQSMVHEFNLPFICASQLNREVEHRGDSQGKGNNKAKKPQLSDLRDSGSLEQDADNVFLLHREIEDNDTLSPILKIKMEKNRQLGPAKSVKLLYNYNLRKYVDIREEINL